MAVALKKEAVEPVLLILEDDEVLRSTLTEVFIRKGLAVHAFELGREAVSFVSTHMVDIALLDLKLPDMDGLEALKEIHKVDPEVVAIVVTAFPDVKTAISAMKAGAHDYINKPFELEELKLLVDKALETKRLRTEVESLRYQQDSQCVDLKMVGNSPLVREVRELVLTVVRSPGTPVLIHGETGTGKELVANAIHCSSERSSGPFIKLNCSAIPDTLLESELFGYEKGAFTDAKQAKKGLFELADGGTLFLDEIGDMDPKLQPKLLQVLEGGSFRKVGGVRDLKVDVRVVAATNRDLVKMVDEKKFRKDLYYRLNVMVIDIPPLRKRAEDIVPIARHFIAMNDEGFGGKITGLAVECEEILIAYQWPGNIRELRNIIERAMILAHYGEIEARHLPGELTSACRGFGADGASGGHMSLAAGADASLDEVERLHILNILETVDGNKTQASKILGISRLTLRGKLKKYAEQGL